MERPLQLASDMELPPFDKDTDAGESLLVVFLVNLGETGEAGVVQHFQQSLKDVNVKTWHPSKLVLQSVAHQGRHKDSQANIYGLAILAYRSGWTGFIVVDGLTKRQINGDIRPGEDELLSVAMVSTKPTREDDGSQVRVVAKRTTGKERDNRAILKALKTLNTSQNFIMDNPKDYTIYTKYGLELYDPNRSVFAAGTVESLGREEVLAAMNAVVSKTSLPTELTMDIVSRVDEEAMQPIKIPPSAGGNKNDLTVFLLFPTTADELHHTQSAIQDAVNVWQRQNWEIKAKENKDKKKGNEEMAVRLIAWEHPRTASRHDLLHIWQAYTRQTDECKMNVLLKPIRNTDVDSAQFGTMYNYEGEPVVVYQQPLSSILKEAQLESVHVKTDRIRQKQDEPFDEDRTEVIGYSYSPLYSNPPPWCAVDPWLNSVSFFYVTNKLTDQQRMEIQEEIVTMTDIDESVGESKVCCFVPWKSGSEDEEDGILEDMLEVVRTFRPHQDRRDGCESPYLFIDQQSAVDHTVIIIEGDMLFTETEKSRALLEGVPDPTLRAFCYGRIPGREAHTVFTNLSIANVSFEEIVENYQTIPKSDWPGHGILRNSFSEEEDDDD